MEEINHLFHQNNRALTKELALLREEDRRVDIVSTSPELLMQVGGSSSPFLKPVEITSVQRRIL